MGTMETTTAMGMVVEVVAVRMLMQQSVVKGLEKSS
jgi:hypothetical protein